jgi:hypothetical protein
MKLTSLKEFLLSSFVLATLGTSAQAGPVVLPDGLAVGDTYRLCT